MEDLLQLPPEDAAKKLNRHLSSLLFVLQYGLFRHVKVDRTSLSKIQLIMIDTRNFPKQTFLRDLDAIRYFFTYPTDETNQELNASNIKYDLLSEKMAELKQFREVMEGTKSDGAESSLAQSSSAMEKLTINKPFANPFKEYWAVRTVTQIVSRMPKQKSSGSSSMLPPWVFKKASHIPCCPYSHRRRHPPILDTGRYGHFWANEYLQPKKEDTGTLEASALLAYSLVSNMADSISLKHAQAMVAYFTVKATVRFADKEVRTLEAKASRLKKDVDRYIDIAAHWGNEVEETEKEGAGPEFVEKVSLRPMYLRDTGLTNTSSQCNNHTEADDISLHKYLNQRGVYECDIIKVSAGAAAPTP
ncbi:hypothetical protein FGRMN_3499 [Fusarium graminum]|nr:hypothetical protein FGRMN_3499 [Fusarium graminum]